MSYQSEAELESQLIKQLGNQNYSYVSIPDYDALLRNFREQFSAFNREKLGNRPLSDKEFDRLLNYMLGRTVYESAVVLRDKYVLERDDGTRVYVLFIDEDHTRNVWQVTNQTTVVGKYTNRYDVTILCNGLPLVQIELKRRGMDLRQAINQIMRYKKHSFIGLYRYIQCFVVSNGVDTKYFLQYSWPKRPIRRGKRMPRPRKDGERVSLFLDREMMERLRAYADEKGQTLTTAMERIIKAHLDSVEAREKDDH